jgi:hypothetical protein
MVSLMLTRVRMLAAIVVALLLPLLQCVTLQGALIAKGGNMTGIYMILTTL